jgi:creatinine amidohydrolase
MRLVTALLALLLAASVCPAQSLSPQWEELTAGDFPKALAASKDVCLLPLGVVEKHGPSAPLGTDVLNVRHVSLLAARSEYALVFPAFYVGQIAEARHQPGTIAYSGDLQMRMLRETTAEMARNGCRKIVLVNGHGGNNALLQFFTQTQLDEPRDFMVYAYLRPATGDLPAAAAPSRPGADGHAGENEVAMIMAGHPSLAHPERASQESGANLDRLKLPAGVFTAIGWYSQFPNHYGGDASGATAARGQALAEAQAAVLAATIRAIKADEVGPRLQQEFFERNGRLRR